MTPDRSNHRDHAATRWTVFGVGVAITIIQAVLFRWVDGIDRQIATHAEKLETHAARVSTIETRAAESERVIVAELRATLAEFREQIRADVRAEIRAETRGLSAIKPRP